MSPARRNAIVIAVVLLCVAAVAWRRDRESTMWTAGDRSPEQAVRTLAGSAQRAAAVGAHGFGQRNVGARRVAGIVLHDGAPVVGATVRLANKLTMAGAVPDLTVVTDASGRFDFGPQAATIWVVAAEKSKLVGALQTIDLRDPRPQQTPDDLHLVLHACSASLRGTIHDEAGGVVPGARVALATADIAIGAGVDADDQGHYELCVPVGESHVTVTADGYERLFERVESYGPLLRDFRLGPEAIVVGRVVRGPDPVAGALVELRANIGWSSSANRSLYTTSDPSGAFRFERVSPGQHEVTATAERLASKPTYVSAEVAASEEIVVALVDTYSVSGTIVERGTKTPASGITAMLYARDVDPGRFPDNNAVSQADGSFTIEGLFPNEYKLGLRLHNIANAPANVIVTNADVGGLVLEVERSGSISGRVTHAGKPVDGVPITARTSQRARATTSDHAGQYVIRDLPAGTYQVYAESKRVGAFTSGPTITLASGEQKSNVDLDMNLAGSIAGVVVDQHGKPVGGVYLRFSLLRGRDFGVATTAADGTFVATALSGGGEYTYEVRADEQSELAYPPAGRKRHPPILVRDGTTRVTGARIEIRLDAKNSIAGRVVDANGAPVPDALVNVQYRRAARSDERGAFTITGLAAGTYDLRANAGARTGHLAGVATGRRDVEVRLAEPASIEGVVEDFAVVPDVVVTNTITGHRYRVTPTNNAFRVRSVPAGTYIASARSTSGVVEQEVEAAPGAIAKVTLRSRGFGTIEGTLVDATRTPLVGRPCWCTALDLYTTYERRGATTDASGTFRCERALGGRHMVACDDAPPGKFVDVIPEQTARVEIVMARRDPVKPQRPARVGLVLEDQLSDVMVKSVEPGSPAARAGFAVGDVIVKVGDEEVRYSELAQSLFEQAKGTTVKVTVERGEQQLVLQLTVEAAEP